MTGILNNHLANDHDRLDGLLTQATKDPSAIDMQLYEEFRKGLLRHISIEEKIVMPTIARLQNGEQAGIASRLRLEHGAIAALLVPYPTPSVLATLVGLLTVHNELEEKPGGLYELLDRLAGSERDDLLQQMLKIPPVRTVPLNSRPEVLEATRRAVERAGYVFFEKE